MALQHSLESGYVKYAFCDNSTPLLARRALDDEYNIRIIASEGLGLLPEGNILMLIKKSYLKIRTPKMS